MEIKVQLSTASLVDWKPAIAAMQDALLLIQDTWIQAVSGNQLPGMTKAVNDDAYVHSLLRGGALQADGPLSGQVHTDYDGAQRIDEGSPPRDMKPSLLNGPHAKVPGKYTIVPFRHGTPGTTGAHFAVMPESIYAQVKNLPRYSRGNGTPSIGNQSGAFPPQSKTFFMPLASALDQSAVHGRMTTTTHKTSIYSGMVKAGAARHTQYLTFRAVSINSAPNSWWYPAIPPNPIRDAVIAHVQADIERILESGWKAAIG